MSATGADGRYSARIHQAEGVVSVQADCTMMEALAKMEDRAKLLGLTLEATAAEILGHRTWFR